METFACQLCAATLLALSLICSVESSTLKQIHVIARHGARTQLPKTELLVEGDATLTKTGEKQMYDLGVWLRSRYQDEGVIETYNSTRHRMESSDFQRTLVSAQSMALGLFPAETRLQGSKLPDGVTPHNIPIFSRLKSNDVILRSYDKCPKFYEKLGQLYASEEWVQKETENHAFLKSLADHGKFDRHVKNGVVPLKELWNVYDAVHVARTECSEASTMACVDEELQFLLPENSWTELEKLAHYAETHKYSIETAGALLGGNILLQIFQRMGGISLDATSSVDRELQQLTDSRFYYYSGHYPTILGVFAALGLRPPKEEALPYYGSALILELHYDDVNKENFVKLFFKEGDALSSLSVEFSGACIGKLECPLDSFRKVLLHNLEFTSYVQWCKACDNESADICLAQQLWEVRTDNGKLETQLQEMQENQSCGSPGGVAGPFFGGAIVGLLIGGVVYCFHRRRQSGKTNEEQVDFSPAEVVSNKKKQKEIDML